jgi:hypothetical protein
MCGAANRRCTIPIGVQSLSPAETAELVPRKRGISFLAMTRRGVTNHVSGRTVFPNCGRCAIMTMDGRRSGRARTEFPPMN